MPRYAAKVDGNQREITMALRAAGWRVRPLHTVGKGFPDLLAGWGERRGGVNVLVECKMPGEKLTPDEQEFHRTWPGPLVIVYSGQDAIDKVQEFRP